MKDKVIVIKKDMDSFGDLTVTRIYASGKIESETYIEGMHYLAEGK